MANPQNRHPNSARPRQNAHNANPHFYINGEDLGSIRYFRNHARALDGSDDAESQTPFAERSLEAGRGRYRYDNDPAYGENTRDNYGSLPQNNNFFGSGSNYGSTYSTGTDYGSERFGKRWRDDDRALRTSHAGKAPKNYLRTDARIEEDANEALTVHEGIDASDIEISVKNGVVTLSGTVPDREMKHFAEDLVAELPGVKDVKNQISSPRFLSRIFKR